MRENKKKEGRMEMESRGGGISDDNNQKEKTGFGESQCGKGGKQRKQTTEEQSSRGWRGKNEGGGREREGEWVSACECVHVKTEGIRPRANVLRRRV